ncbi:hypothetical protein [Pseudomonas sp. UBA1879]|uniref:hypothetical protein n=1 Tax=Pseudomonas sp. UBA1879 TaxID=1947305 RepID=UPI0026010D88|nr:hypothetical protein [Pseudomonas sp. UBA1879]
MSYFYKSEAPATVAIVRDFYDRKDAQRAAMKRLGELFGGVIAPMQDMTSCYAGGVKLSSSRELDVHWCRPDDHGYRSLRTNAIPPKGISKQERAAIRDEHKRLVEQWNENCPPRLSIHETWSQLRINTGNLLLSGGIFFEFNSVAYFNLGFSINEAAHLANVAYGRPSAGWISGATEITTSEYEAARQSKLQVKAVADA